MIVPGIVLIVGLMVGGYRLWCARAAVTSAAEAAARAATLQPSGTQARTAGLATAHDDLSRLDVRCAASTVTVDTSAFNLPAGSVGDVTVVVACTVPMADLALPGMPGTLNVQSTAHEVLDTFRERRP